MNNEEHKRMLGKTVKAINEDSSGFILKGGTALLLFYGLDRMSVDIDLDAAGARSFELREKLKGIIEDYSRENGWEYRIGKDTDAVQRFFIHYSKDNERLEPLKIEVSFRNNEIEAEEVCSIEGIRVYTLDALAQRKASTYLQRDKIRDLYDICYICANKYSLLSKESKRLIRWALEYKGIEQFDYMIRTQPDPLINSDVLETRFLEALEKNGLLMNRESEKETHPPRP